MRRIALSPITLLQYLWWDSRELEGEKISTAEQQNERVEVYRSPKRVTVRYLCASRNLDLRVQDRSIENSILRAAVRGCPVPLLSEAMSKIPGSYPFLSYIGLVRPQIGN